MFNKITHVLFFMFLISNSAFSSNTISVINYNVAGHLNDYSHSEKAYKQVFKKINKSNIDFVGTVEMLANIQPKFADALNYASDEYSKAKFRYIGRVRGGLDGQSPDEMVSIFYNSTNWQLTEYQKLEDNPVLRNNCNEYVFNISGEENKPCQLSLKYFSPSENPNYHYTFPLNYVDNTNRKNYFPGDIKNQWGPWNRMATFGVFTSTEASSMPPDTKVIVIATHFPKGKGSDVQYKKAAFRAVYDFVIKPLAKNNPEAKIIFMGDLNYKSNRDKSEFNLLEYINGKSYFSGSNSCGNKDDVLWTVASPNLIGLECQEYPVNETFNTTDHIITQTIYQLN